MDERVQKQLEEMEELITAATEAPYSEPPSGEAETLAPTTVPSTEAPSSSAPATAAPATAAPQEDGTGEPADAGPPDSPSVAALKAEIAELRALLPKPEKPKEEEPKPVEEEDFIGDLDTYELTQDPAKLNAVLNSLYKKAIEKARAEISAKYADMPNLVQSSVDAVTTIRNRVEKFYEENIDLAPFKKVVEIVFGELADPSKDQEIILKEVATETRKRLNLPTPSSKRNEDDDPPPRPPRRGKQARQQQPKSDPFQSELSAMEEALNS